MLPTIYLATDPDREGEAIAWHLAEVTGTDKKPFHRVVFREITEEAVKEAFQTSPRYRYAARGRPAGAARSGPARRL